MFDNTETQAEKVVDTDSVEVMPIEFQSAVQQVPQPHELTAIKATTTYSYENILRLQRFHILKSRLWLVFMLLMDAIMLASIIITSVRGIEYAGDIVFIVLMALIILLTPFMIFVLPVIIAKRQKREFGTKTDFSFGEYGLHVVSTASYAVSNMDARYEMFKKVYETKNEFYLYIDGMQVFPIEKSGIESGEAALKELLMRKIPPQKYVKRGVK